MRNFKRFFYPAGFLLLVMLLHLGLRYCLMGNSLARVDIHRATHQTYEDLFIGTSHGLSALNPEKIGAETGRTGTNLCMPNQRLTDSYYLIREICKSHRPKRIVYELDPTYWCIPYTNGESTNYVYANLPLSLLKAEYAWAKNKDRDFRDTLAVWHYYRSNLRSIPSILREKSQEPYKSYSISALNRPGCTYTEEGYLYQEHDPDGEKLNPEYALWNRDNLEQKEQIYFEKLAEFCKEQEIELVVITTPVPRESLRAHSTEYADAHAFFTSYMEKLQIPYYDCTVMEIDQEGYDPTLRGFLDHEGHMSGEQGNAFSTWLGKLLRA